MKAHYFITTKDFKAFVLLLIAAPVMLSRVYAQSHDMHMHSGVAQSSKNIFLAMMDTMMAGMDRAPQGKFAETEFLQQMMVHHQGAVNMARYEIRYGKNFDMVQLAKSILAEQQSEISQMQISLRQLGNVTAASSPVFVKAMEKTMEDMMKNLPAEETLNDIDHAFARVMLPHHQAAVDMAKTILRYGTNPETLAFAKALISNEQIEIEQMSTYIQ